MAMQYYSALSKRMLYGRENKTMYFDVDIECFAELGLLGWFQNLAL